MRKSTVLEIDDVIFYLLIIVRWLIGKKFLPLYLFLILHSMPTQHSKEEKCAAFGRFLDVLDELRLKCPWDRKQTNESLRANTIEETYELCEAITNNDPVSIKKELGDVLLHIAFYAKIGEEKNLYDIADVCDALCE